MFADASHLVHMIPSIIVKLLRIQVKRVFMLIRLKEKVMSRSYFDAELNSFPDTIPQVTGTRSLMVVNGHSVGEIKMWQDNMSTVALLK